MTALPSIFLLAAAQAPMPFVDTHPFRDNQVAADFVTKAADAVYIHHEQQNCPNGYRIVIDIVLPVSNRPSDIKIIDPGCAAAHAQAENLVRRLTFVPRSHFATVDQPTRFRLKVKIAWPEYAPAE
jgi:hypothetical protein